MQNECWIIIREKRQTFDRELQSWLESNISYVTMYCTLSMIIVRFAWTINIRVNNTKTEKWHNEKHTFRINMFSIRVKIYHSEKIKIIKVDVPWFEGGRCENLEQVRGKKSTITVLTILFEKIQLRTFVYLSTRRF